VSAEEQAHELLLRLVGRLPGTLVWRLREWLAAGGQPSVAAVLPRELLIGSAGARGAKPRLLDAVLPLPAPEEAPVLFAPDPVLDAAALTALAIVKSHPGTLELHQARRGGQRVLVVFGGDAPWLLTGTLQRILRAHGDRTPCVEVLPNPDPPTAYHRAAVSGSAALWRSPRLATAAS